MKMDDYQEGAGKTAMYAGKWEMGGLVYTVLGLASEAGEVAGKLKKILRDKGGEMGQTERDALAAELGDCLWYVAMVASEIGYDLSAVAEMNLQKLASRKHRGVITGSGDAR